MKKFALSLLFITVAANAAQYPPEYRWRTLTTEHFYIHFHQGEEELAQRAAAIAERVHTRITPMFDYEPSQRRTHIILTDHIDAANGSATPFPNNRIEIYVSSPGADPSSAIEWYDNWLNLVITHEYAHILHLDQANGMWRGLRYALGRHPITFPNAFSPLWITEGVATLVESEATDAGRLKGTFVDMVLRTAAAEDRWFTAAQAGGLSPAWPGGSARYFYGSKFLDWVADKQGMDKLAQFFHDYAGNVIPYRVNASAEAVFGEEMSDLYNQWSAEQQRIYKEEVERIRADGLTDRKRLTNLGFETRYPIVSADGKRVAYGHESPYGWSSVRIWDVLRGEDSASVRVNSTSPMSWSPDGTAIAFSQLEFRGSFALLSDLWIWDVAKDDLRRLTRGARLKDPSFTPDGRTLIAVENRAGRNLLVAVDIASGAIRPVVTPDDFTQFSEPNVSHDGTKIAVAEWRNGRIDIVVYGIDGRREANLTESLARSANGSPRWGPDDRTLFFTSDVTGVPNVYAARERELRRVSNVYGGAFFPSTADGQRMYISDYTSNGWELATYELTESYPITARSGGTAAPSGAQVASGEGAAEGSGPPLESSSYNPWRSALPTWWTPLVGAGTDDEALYGFQTSGNDVLGFHNYTLTLLGDTYSAIYSYDRLAPTLTFAALQYEDEIEEVRIPGVLFSESYREQTRRFLAQATFPLRRYRWQLSGSAGYVRDDISEDVPDRLTLPDLGARGVFTGTLHGLRLSGMFNNAAEFGYSVSPENGVTALAAFEQLGGDADVRTARLDLRGYLGIPYRRSPMGRHALAMRVAGSRRSGDFVLQRDAKVGGEGLGEFVTLDTTDLPVRGYAAGALRGDSAMIASVEYRFPIWQIERGPGVWPIFFHRIIGDVFFDTGTAWNSRAVTLPALTRPKTDPWDERISSIGAEVAADIVLGYVAPLRWRLGVAHLLDARPGDSEVQVYLTLGSSF